MTTTDLVHARGGALPALLSDGLQERARRYVAARRRSGEALLEAVAELAAARAEARHGEWTIFLEALGLDESAARAQIRIAELAAADPVYAERIRSGFLTEATAREVLSLPAETRAELLGREELKSPNREPAPALAPPSPAERALITAQNAPPGSRERGEALLSAGVLIRITGDSTLTTRYQTLQREHQVAKGAETPRDPAGVLPAPITTHERTAVTAAELVVANRTNPAWQAGGFSIAEQIRDADDREVVLIVASLFEDGAEPIAAPADLLDLEQALIRAARAWAVGHLVAAREAA
jgi:hypothetical protein